MLSLIFLFGFALGAVIGLGSGFAMAVRHWHRSRSRTIDLRQASRPSFADTLFVPREIGKGLNATNYRPRSKN